MATRSPILLLTAPMILEWAYRYGERCALMCEDRVPSPKIEAIATAEANAWLADEVAFREIDQELPF